MVKIAGACNAVGQSCKKLKPSGKCNYSACINLTGTFPNWIQLYITSVYCDFVRWFYILFFLYQLLCECSSGPRSSGSNWSKNFILYFVHCWWWWILLYTAAPVQRGAPAGAGHKTDSVLNLLQGYLTIQRFRDKKLSRHHFWKALHFFIEVGNSLKTNQDRKSRRPYLWRRSLLQSDIMAVSSAVQSE